jgi:hypothetical protein
MKTSVRPVASAGPIVTAKQLLRRYKAGERHFHFINLNGANLSGSELTGASFYEASMRGVDLSGCMLTHVQLKGADLTDASMEHAFINASDLIGTDFTRARLRSSDFVGATLNGAICAGADLSFARLASASLGQIELKGAKLRGIKLGHTDFGDTDIRPFCSAARVHHDSPSSIDARAVMRSYPHVKLKPFMLECGVPALFADYMIDCARAIGEPLMRRLLQSIFISYGAPDENFARQLYDALNEHGVNVFFFPETARLGERISNEVYRQLQAHDRVLLICSKKSLNRAGVLNEIQQTLDREARDGGASYLLPVMVDDYVLTGWRKAQPSLAERVAQRIIADFRKSKGNKLRFSAAVDRVIDALKIDSPSRRR